jgi:hypothetical protein
LGEWQLQHSTPGQGYLVRGPCNKLDSSQQIGCSCGVLRASYVANVVCRGFLADTPTRCVLLFVSPVVAAVLAGISWTAPVLYFFFQLNKLPVRAVCRFVVATTMQWYVCRGFFYSYSLRVLVFGSRVAAAIVAADSPLVRTFLFACHFHLLIRQSNREGC